MSRFKNKLLMTASVSWVITFLMSSASESAHRVRSVRHGACCNLHGRHCQCQSDLQHARLLRTMLRLIPHSLPTGHHNAVIRDDTGKVIAMKRGMAVTQSSATTLTFSSTYPVEPKHMSQITTSPITNQQTRIRWLL
jgi:hypothetical protein